LNMLKRIKIANEVTAKFGPIPQLVIPLDAGMGTLSFVPW